MNWPITAGYSALSDILSQPCTTLQKRFRQVRLTNEHASPRRLGAWNPRTRKSIGVKLWLSCHSQVLLPTAAPREMWHPSSALQWVARSPSRWLLHLCLQQACDGLCICSLQASCQLSTTKITVYAPLPPKTTPNLGSTWDSTHRRSCEKVVLLDALRLGAVAPPAVKTCAARTT